MRDATAYLSVDAKPILTSKCGSHRDARLIFSSERQPHRDARPVLASKRRPHPDANAILAPKCSVHPDARTILVSKCLVHPEVEAVPTSKRASHRHAACPSRATRSLFSVSSALSVDFPTPSPASLATFPDQRPIPAALHQFLRAAPTYFCGLMALAGCGFTWNHISEIRGGIPPPKVHSPAAP